MTSGPPSNFMTPPPYTADNVQPTHKSDYRPDIDGLRAVAVALVILFHAGLGFPGGFIGVDVFFVISGFLITQLLTREIDEQTFTFAGFWARRIGRIVPAATTMTLVVLVMGFFLLLPSDYVDLGLCAIAQQCMASNVYLWKTTGYFAGPAEMNPLLHTWSLAVEEQFYLGYPLFLALFRGARIGWRATGLATLAVASFLLSCYGTSHFPSATFFLLPTRAWEIAIGGLVCYLPPPSWIGRRGVTLAGCAAAASIVAASWLYNSSTPFPGVAAAVPCLAAATLIYVNGVRTSAISRFLSSKPLVTVGLASYSLYLWHWPLLAFARYWSPSGFPLGVRLAAMTAGVVLALLSWRFIENPLRRIARVSRSGQCYAGAAIAAAVIVGMGIVIQQFQGFPNRLPESAKRFLELPHYRISAAATTEALERGELVRVGQPSESDSPDFLVWGDSHAGVTADLMDELAMERGLGGVVAAQPGTAPIPGVFNRFSPREDQRRRSKAVIHFLREKGIRNVVIVAKWQNYVRDRGTYGLIDDETRDDGDARTPKQVLVDGLDRLCAGLEENGVKVWIVLRVPHQSIDPRKRLAAAAMFGVGIPSGISADEWIRDDADVNDSIRAMASLHPAVSVIDPSSSCFGPKGLSRIADAGGTFYRDPGHVSPHGARMLLGPSLAPVFDAIGSDRRSTDSRR